MRTLRLGIILPAVMLLLSACAVGDGLAILASGAADGTKYIVKQVRGDQTADAPQTSAPAPSAGVASPITAPSYDPPAPAAAPKAPIESIELEPLTN